MRVATNFITQATVIKYCPKGEIAMEHHCQLDREPKTNKEYL